MVVNITYETLFEILRNERTKEELQLLDKEFFNNVKVYLNEKKKIADDRANEGLFGADERSTTLRQLESIKKILNELYQLRERKIINLALHKSRTESKVETNMLLEQEEEFYKALVALLDKYREGIIKNILTFKEINLAKEEAEIEPEKQLGTKLIRFKIPVPSFVGTNLETYGPFDPEDVANLPTPVAEVIINKGRANEVKIN